MSDTASAVVSCLAGARKCVKLYPSAHPKFEEALDGLVSAVRDATAAGPFVLNIHQGRLYHDSAVIAEDVPGARSIAEALEARRVESIALHAGFGTKDGMGLVDVLSVKPSPDLDLEGELTTRDVGNVSLAYLADDEEAEREERDRRREQDRALYRQLVGVLRSVSSRLAAGEEATLGEAPDLVRSILERLLQDQAAVLGMAMLRGGNEADLYHGLNVMIYALSLGGELGLPEEGLASLGVCALLHDIGKARFKQDGDADALRLLHPSAGAEVLSRMGIDDPAPMLVAYEHHMGVDGTGYPERAPNYVAHPYSRMVAVADRYERLTRPNSKGTCLTPDRAIMRLLSEAGRPLDPLLTRVFVRAMGVFPVGCVVRLSDMRVGVVCAPTPENMAPRVRVLYDENGRTLEAPEEVETSGGPAIVEVVDPDNLRLEVSEAL